MGNPRWPYDPYDPYARRPGQAGRQERADDGWVVAGEEQNGWVPPPRNGQRGEIEPYRRRAAPEPYARTPEPYDQYGRYSPPPYSPYPPDQGAGYPYTSAAAPRGYPPPARLDDGPGDEPRPLLAPALTWTVLVFVVPMLLYLAWAFTRSGVAPAGCVDASGAPCLSPRAEAAEQLLGVLPAISGAFVLSLLIAAGLRRIAITWRSGSVGIAGAVIGAGIATVVATAFS